MEKKHNDPSNYAHCSQPHDGIEHAHAAMDRFTEAVAEARKKYRIANVVIGLELNVTIDGEMKRMFGDVQFGDEHYWKHLAYGLAGMLSRREKEREAALLSGVTGGEEDGQG
jgi:hypothetical protein